MKKVFTAVALSGALAVMGIAASAQAEPHRSGTVVYGSSPVSDAHATRALQTGRSAYRPARPVSGPDARANTLLGDDVDVGH